MYAIEHKTLIDAIQDAWSYETSNNTAWRSENPSLGQCAVTVCVVQDYLGGEIYNNVATFPDGKIESHYFNIVEGEIVDLTKQQFPEETIFSEGEAKTKEHNSTREYCLSFETTRKRYEILKARVANRLNQ